MSVSDALRKLRRNSKNSRGSVGYWRKRDCIEFLKENGVLEEGDVKVGNGLRTSGFRKVVKLLKNEVFEE